MASKSGKVKRFVLIAVLVFLLCIVFILVGGGKLLKSAGVWIGGVGNKAESIRGKIEEGATSVEKKAEQIKETVTSGEKK